jgi:hypothetical protein
MKDKILKDRVLFYRRLLKPNSGINGGNLKLRDCFDHILHSETYRPTVYFSKDTIWNNHPGNYWSSLRHEALTEWAVEKNDLLFFSGFDWQVLSKHERINPPVPIINIVQPRHTRSSDGRQAFLKHPAIRIVKSEAGATILNNHGVNGPLFLIPDGIDLALLPSGDGLKDIDVLVLGLKQPELAREVYEDLIRLNDQNYQKLNIQVQLPPPLSTRHDFLKLLNRARITVCLPLEPSRGSEGFYLPALEAMAMKTIVICPHAVGNEGHCIDEVNCLVPEYKKESIFVAVKKVLRASNSTKSSLIKNGLATAQKHNIHTERKAILELLEQAQDIWNEFPFN